MPIIELKNISHSYQTKEILSNFYLSVEANKTTCLLGSSGCGKTTILRLIAGLEKPQKGSIIIDNQEVTKGSCLIKTPDKREIGFVFQDLALWPHFTVFKNIAFGLSENKIPNIDEKVNSILEFFNLHEHSNKYPHQLSGGQQQLVAIARSLVMNPKILLMDEPLANLDVKLKRKILNYINEIKSKYKITIVYVTHDHKEAFSISDQIVVLNNGNIEDNGSINDIKNSNNEYVQSFIEY